MSRGIRKGQTVSTAGPGAIVDLGDESFVVMSIDTWRYEHMVPCDLPRLSSRIGVAKLLQPQTGDNRNPNSSIGLLRFPRWMFCPSCRQMVRWSNQDEARLGADGSGKPVCDRPSCSRGIQLVPIRFVRICENGHLDDIDWLFWVHQKGPQQCHDPKQLHFESLPGRGSGLESLQIKCKQCSSTRSLRDLQQYEPLCRSASAYSGGRQPWQRDEHGIACSAKVAAVQRGDSNVHFSRQISALDIPDPNQKGAQESAELQILQNNEFMRLEEAWRSLEQNDINPANVPNIQQRISALADQFGISHDSLQDLIVGQSDAPAPSPAVTTDPIRELKAEEFAVLSTPEHQASPFFSGESYQPQPEQFGVELSRILERVSLLDRLREVRAMQGFQRKKPSSGGLVPASLDQNTDWLPAYEVFGEGLFFKFNAEYFREWQTAMPKAENARLQRLQDRITRQKIAFLPSPSPALVVIHGLSHVLMRQLCFDSGYASSSLRERIYVDGDSLGLLIYTADGDSEGTMGGLVRQGRPGQLPVVFARALKTAFWCSADPLCSEGENQGMAGLNRAACHACLLVSETSCESANALLDRRFLVGQGDHFQGLFTSYLVEQGIH